MELVTTVRSQTASCSIRASDVRRGSKVRRCVYTAISIRNMLIDCADRVLTAPDEGTATRTAMVGLNFDKLQTAVVASKTNTPKWHAELCTRSRRVVHPYVDPHVWAVVDEGYKSCTHPERMRKDAERKWKKFRFALYLKSSKAMTFFGIGTRQAKCKQTFHVALQLEEAQLVVPGALDSHEISDVAGQIPHCLLLSQSVQAKLGFDISARRGTIYLDDDANQHLVVVRQAGSRLFMF